MTDFFDKVVDTWASKGLGVVMGEWGVTDHTKGSQSDLQHENVTYYCKFLVSETKKRGFSTFIWDNNAFGNGSEKFGIFDRERGLKVKCPWVLQGIMEGKK
jgi:endoglucanase